MSMSFQYSAMTEVGSISLRPGSNEVKSAEDFAGWSLIRGTSRNYGVRNACNHPTSYLRILRNHWGEEHPFRHTYGLINLTTKYSYLWYWQGFSWIVNVYRFPHVSIKPASITPILHLSLQNGWWPATLVHFDPCCGLIVAPMSWAIYKMPIIMNLAGLTTSCCPGTSWRCILRRVKFSGRLRQDIMAWVDWKTTPLKSFPLKTEPRHR